MKTLTTITLLGMLIYSPSIDAKKDTNLLLGEYLEIRNESRGRQIQERMPVDVDNQRLMDTYSCKCKRKTCRIISNSPPLCSCNSIKYIMKVLEQGVGK